MAESWAKEAEGKPGGGPSLVPGGLDGDETQSERLRGRGRRAEEVLWWERRPSVPLRVGGRGHGESPLGEGAVGRSTPQAQRWALCWQRPSCPHETALRQVEGLVLSEAPKESAGLERASACPSPPTPRVHFEPSCRAGKKRPWRMWVVGDEAPRSRQAGQRESWLAGNLTHRPGCGPPGRFLAHLPGYLWVIPSLGAPLTNVTTERREAPRPGGRDDPPFGFVGVAVNHPSVWEAREGSEQQQIPQHSPLHVKGDRRSDVHLLVRCPGSRRLV